MRVRNTPNRPPCACLLAAQITRTGVDGMMTRLLKELTWLAGEARVAAAGGSAVVGALPDLLASPRWDFIYNVGTMVSAWRSLLLVRAFFTHVQPAACNRPLSRLLTCTNPS